MSDGSSEISNQTVPIEEMRAEIPIQWLCFFNITII